MRQRAIRQITLSLEPEGRQGAGLAPISSFFSAAQVSKFASPDSPNASLMAFLTFLFASS